MLTHRVEPVRAGEPTFPYNAPSWQESGRVAGGDSNPESLGYLPACPQKPVSFTWTWRLVSSWSELSLQFPILRLHKATFLNLMLGHMACIQVHFPGTVGSALNLPQAQQRIGQKLQILCPPLYSGVLGRHLAHSTTELPIKPNVMAQACGLGPQEAETGEPRTPWLHTHTPCNREPMSHNANQKDDGPHGCNNGMVISH